MIFALASTTRLVSAADLYRLGQALEKQAAQVCSAYLISEPVAIVPIDDPKQLPEGAFPIVCEETRGDPGTLGLHWFDRKRDIPAARVLVQNTSGLNAGPHSVSEAASHELIEALVNPRLAGWRVHPLRPDIEVAYEAADPTQDHYFIEAQGTRWTVSNWITPFWWEARFRDAHLLQSTERDFGYGLDWCMRMREPGEISSEGYFVARKKDARGRYQTWSEDRDGVLARGSPKLVQKHHPASRTKRLGGVVE